MGPEIVTPTPAVAEEFARIVLEEALKAKLGPLDTAMLLARVAGRLHAVGDQQPIALHDPMQAMIDEFNKALGIVPPR